jgi:FkbM family methyltransferase
MTIKQRLAKNETLRAIFFPLIRKLNFEFRWKHDVTKRKFFLLTFLHKGYWYYGWQREKNELARFKEFINKADYVLEIGGHIGYVTQIFEDLVGKDGRVFVAEPTAFTRIFLKKNVLPSTKILPLAVSNIEGQMDFYTEEFGGFTNSLISEFTSESDKNLSVSQNRNSSKIIKNQVDVSTIDLICKEHEFKPNFIKIDVEGAELRVLQGATSTLNTTTALMVEISQNHEDIYDLLFNLGFSAKDSEGKKLSDNTRGGNIFFYR